MKQIYVRPEIHTTAFANEDIITISGGLTNGGANGQSPSESFGSLFGK